MKRRYILTVIACCGLCVGSVGLCHNVDGVYYSAVCNELGLGRGTVSFYATISVLTTSIVCPIIVRKINSKNAKFIIGGGSMLTILSVIGIGLSKNIIAVYIFAMLRGAGCACFSLVMISVILRNWFKDKFAEMSGITMGFSGISGMIASPLIAAVISRFNYHTAYIIAALCIFIFTIPGIILVIHYRPEDIGLKPYEEGKGDIDLIERKKEDHEGFVPVDYRSPVFIALNAAAITSATITSFIAHLPGFAENFGLFETAALLLSGAMFGNVAFKFIYGYFIDHFDAVRVGLFGNAFHIAAALGLLLVPKIPALLIFLSVLFGSASAQSALTMNTAMPSYVYGSANYAKTGSLVAMTGGICAAFGFAIFGFLYDITKSYTSGIMLCIAFDLISLVCLLYIKRVCRKAD